MTLPPPTLHASQQTPAAAQFLNVCVGARTYFYFFLLVTLGFTLFVWHMVACALVAAGPWRDASAGTDGVIFASVVTALGTVGVLGLGLMAFFHIYLVARGNSTYDFLMKRAEAILIAENQREQAEADRARRAATPVSRHHATATATADVTVREVAPREDDDASRPPSPSEISLYEAAIEVKSDGSFGDVATESQSQTAGSAPPSPPPRVQSSQTAGSAPPSPPPRVQPA
jgi:hypothetical protein